MILINRSTKKPVAVGDAVTTFWGEKATMIGWSEPHKPGSTGRIYVRLEGECIDDSFFPSVCDTQFVQEI